MNSMEREVRQSLHISDKARRMWWRRKGISFISDSRPLTKREESTNVHSCFRCYSWMLTVFKSPSLKSLNSFFLCSECWNRVHSFSQDFVNSLQKTLSNICSFSKSLWNVEYFVTLRIFPFFLFHLMFPVMYELIGIRLAPINYTFLSNSKVLHKFFQRLESH